MIAVLILVCGMATSHADCTPATALDVTVSAAPDELACMRDGQALLASTALIPRADEYIVIRCERRRKL